MCVWGGGGREKEEEEEREGGMESVSVRRTEEQGSGEEGEGRHRQ